MAHASALEIQATVQEHSAPLQALAALFQALHQRSVRYCHWKSNLRLAQALQGQTDLDLLVDRRHSWAFRQLLYEQDIKPALAAPGRRYPAIEDYLGFDPASGRLFHLHVHYQLVLGEPFVKNYRLPLEAHLLGSVQLRQGVKIPAPEWELILLSLRALLKYRDRDVIKDLLSIRSPAIPGHIRDEITWLLSQTSTERLAETLSGVAEVVPAGVVLDFLRTVTAAPGAGYRLYRLRERARQALHPHQRRHRLSATLQYLREVWRRSRLSLKFSPVRNMTFLNGGATLALIGADGAGKSTMCQLLARWLAWKLDVHAYYLGSKAPSRLSTLLYLLFRMARRSHSTLSRVLGEREQHGVSRWLAGVREGLLYLHHLSIGWDRYRRYLAGRKQAMAGSIVIFDRYPLETISSRVDYRLLDGPQIPPVSEVPRGPILRALAEAEQRLYRKIRPPDYLFMLDVSPEVSSQRKPDHDRVVVEAKSRAVGDLASMAKSGRRDVNLIPLDADRPIEEVLSQFKAKLWERL